MKTTIITTAAVALLSSSMAFAEGTVRRGTASQPAPSTMNNQGTHQGTMNQQGVTATDQNMNNKSDTELTRMVREKIMADNTLSAKAKNITIVTNSGKITLRGQVTTAQEKAKVEDIAKRTSGTMGVDNQTTINK